jgi:two-component system OmpR family response regulator
MTAKRILVIDDERQIVDIVRAYLAREGYQVAVAYDGPTALERARREHPDLVVLDLMLPGLSGWDVCRKLRENSQVPIIMLTAREEVADRIVGLEIGADDYVSKPFDPRELVARVRAVLRRGDLSEVSTDVISHGELWIDTGTRHVTVAGRGVSLTPTEFDLLAVLVRSPGRVFTRGQLLDRIQGDDYEGYERTIDSHIKNLRKKLAPDGGEPQWITTVHGIGYRLEAPRDAT